MCGIYGIFQPGAPLAESAHAWAEEARHRLRHRGPDGHERRALMDGRCLLGHNRLAIIDLEGGAQPLANENESVWVICNGEIYNYVELRQKLIARGHRFRSQSDCEVLVHLYEEKRHELVGELEGMFAFALLDVLRGELLLARDRFGEKPLYWAELRQGGIAFASEMKALMTLPEVDRSLDVAAVAQFLAVRYVPAPRTHLRGIGKLRAGATLSVNGSGIKRNARFFVPEIPDALNGHAPSHGEAIDQIRHQLRQAVRIRLRSDVPVGAFLSGGIDSTHIVCAIRDLMPGANLSTFCASFDDDRLNEAPFARKIAQHIASDHHEIHFSADDMLAVFDELIDHYDEPFADVSMLPTFAVCRAARQTCKVMLSGDGGDECFAGYRNYFQYYRWHRLRHAPGANEFFGVLADHWRKGSRGTGLLNFLRSNDWELLYPEDKRNQIQSAFLPGYREEAGAGLRELESAESHHARLPFPLSAMESVLNQYLPEQILVKVDRASMRSGLESRAPFLDSRLFDYARQLPLEYHFARGQGKALVREALPSWVPDDIRWRDKQGFTPPLSRWLRKELKQHVQNALEEYAEALRPVLDPSPARQLFARHLAGEDTSDQLFRWLVLIRRCRDLDLDQGHQ
jgi:asparagine synthase (glutamine-hydrolysing)